MGWMKSKDETSADERVDEMDLCDVVIPFADEGSGEEWYVGVTGSCGGLWQKVSSSPASMRDPLNQ
jgi:peptide-N4-(N-acetyl-beta-glucosaminyl)asparagine amidase